MTLLRPGPHAHFTAVEGEGMVLDMERGEYLALNRTATVLWEVLSAADSWEESLPMLQARLAAEPAVLLDAARRFLRQVDEAGLTTTHVSADTL